jgi:hypothetical protein
MPSSAHVFDATNSARFAALDLELQDILLDAAEMGLVRTNPGIEQDQALALLRNNENFHVLANVVLSQRDAWFQNFARGMAQSPNLVDQREVDEKRGYFRGAVYYTQHLPRIAARRLEKEKEEPSVITT